MLDLDNIDFKTVDVTVDEDGNGWFIEENDEAMEAAMADMEADMADEYEELENN